MEPAFFIDDVVMLPWEGCGGEGEWY